MSQKELSTVPKIEISNRPTEQDVRMNKDSAEDQNSVRSSKIDFTVPLKVVESKKPQPDANGFTFYKTASMGIFKSKDDDFANKRITKKRSRMMIGSEDPMKPGKMSKKKSNKVKNKSSQRNLLVGESSEIEDGAINNLQLRMAPRVEPDLLSDLSPVNQGNLKTLEMN